MATRHPSLIVLEALLDAPRKVEIGDSLWTMTPVDKTLCIVAEALDSEGNSIGERWLNNELPLSTFIKMCERLSPGEVAVLAAENVLNRVGPRSRE